MHINQAEASEKALNGIPAKWFDHTADIFFHTAKINIIMPQTRLCISMHGILSYMHDSI